MDSQDSKRERSTNFMTEEVDILLELVHKHKDVIEAKKTDAVSWKNKALCWEKLTKEFNFISGKYPRSSKKFKLKYEGIKKTLKKKVSKNKAEMYKTGGGVPEIIKISPNEEKLLSVIGLSVSGLNPRFDSDIMDITTHENDDNVLDSNVTLEDADVETFELDHDTTEHVTLEHFEKPESEPEEEGEESQINTEGERDWSQWNPAVLKTPIHKHLKIKKNTKNSNNLQNDLEVLTKLKITLINHQILIAKQELELKKIDLEKKAQLYDLDIEIKKNELAATQQRLMKK